MREDRARDLQQPKDIVFIHTAGFVVADLLHATEQAEIGVVGEDVDGAESLHGFGRDFDGLRLLVDI